MITFIILGCFAFALGILLFAVTLVQGDIADENSERLAEHLGIGGGAE